MRFSRVNEKRSQSVNKERCEYVILSVVQRSRNARVKYCRQFFSCKYCDNDDNIFVNKNIAKSKT